MVSHRFAVGYAEVTKLVADLNGKFVATGLQLRTDKNIMLGQRVAMHFRVKQPQIEIIAEADIAWIDDTQDAKGKRAFLLRNLVLDQNSRAKLEAYYSGQAAVPTPVETVATAPVAQASQPVAPQPHAPAQTTAPQPQQSQSSTESVFDTTMMDTGTSADADDTKKKKIIAISALVVLLIGSVALWVFQFGGMEFILSRWGATPKMVAPPALTARNYEPMPALKPPVIKKVIAKSVVREIEPIQGQTYNRFNVVLDRRPRSVFGVNKLSPPRYELTIKHARAGTDRPQYFLPFTYIRTVSVEQIGSDVRVTFIANQSYVPQVNYEIDGTQVIVTFKVSD